MHLNWIDWLIIAGSIYAVVDGWQRGLLALIANFISFVGSLWFAVRFNSAIGNFFTRTFGISPAWSQVLGYLSVGLIVQLILETLCLEVISRLPSRIRASRTNTWLGSVVSLANMLVMTSFALLLLLALPLRGTVKSDIRSSVLGTKLIVVADAYGGQVRGSLEDIANKASKFLTVEPGSNESIPIDIPKDWHNFSVDGNDEKEMLVLVNRERQNRGLAPLAYDAALTKVAEAKSRDMFERRYFSHYDPDGKNASDHLNDAGIAYTVVGENLAYAPDLSTAHNGLINSPGHRANILEVRFKKVGIGVISGGIYGKMYTQEFTD